MHLNKDSGRGGWSHADVWGKSIPGRRNSACEDLVTFKALQRPWGLRGMWVGERTKREARRCQGSTSVPETLAFTLKKMGGRGRLEQSRDMISFRFKGLPLRAVRRLGCLEIWPSHIG